MNIVLVAPYRLAGTGGIATFVRCLQQSLHDHGHKATSLLAGDTNVVRAADRTQWNKVYEIYLRVPFVSGALSKGFLAFWFYLPRALYSLARFLRQQGADIVHINYPSAALFYFAILRPFSRWKLVVSFHGSDVHRFAEQAYSARWMVKFLLMQADLVTACSRSLLAKLGTISQRLIEKGVCVPNANPIKEEGDATHFCGLVPDKFILSVGSLIHRKGHDVLIRALGKAKEKGFFINLVIVGGGSEAANLSNVARSVGVFEQIHFAGEVEHDKVHGYYTKCRYFVLATRAEGMPLTLLEAMTFGKAVIATTVDGIPEIIHDSVTGLLVPPENAEALANALVRLESDSALRTKLAKQAQAFVLREHTWERLTDRYIEIYERLLGAKTTLGYERRPIGS